MSADERCRCGQPADFRCESNEVGEAYEEKRGGQVVRVQPFRWYYLCAACTKAALLGDDRPRKADALPHHAALLRRQHREAADALVGTVVEPRLGEDWGKR